MIIVLALALSRFINTDIRGPVQEGQITRRSIRKAQHPRLISASTASKCTREESEGCPRDRGQVGASYGGSRPRLFVQRRSTQYYMTREANIVKIRGMVWPEWRVYRYRTEAGTLRHGTGIEIYSNSPRLNVANRPSTPTPTIHPRIPSPRSHRTVLLHTSGTC